MRLTFNKNDWSGEEATINVHQKQRAWWQNGYRFRLEPIVVTAARIEYAIKGDDWSDDYVLGKVYQDVGFDTTFCAQSGECCRFDENEFIAASQLLFNIV